MMLVGEEIEIERGGRDMEILTGRQEKERDHRQPEQETETHSEQERKENSVKAMKK